MKCSKSTYLNFVYTKSHNYNNNNYVINTFLYYFNSGSWKDVSFKKYNFDAEGIQPKGGYLHPLMKVREEFRQIFFQMGYECYNIIIVQ